MDSPQALQLPQSSAYELPVGALFSLPDEVWKVSSRVARIFRHLISSWLKTVLSCMSRELTRRHFSPSRFPRSSLSG
jgi:hypothetical protein